MGMDNNNNQRLALAQADSNGSHIRMNNSRSGGGYFVMGVGDSASNSSIVPAGGLFFYNGTTRMVINSSGNVGIGTASPQRPLHVNGTEGVARFTSTASGNNGFEVGIGTSSQAFLWQSENAHMEFATNNVERMRITSDGKVVVQGKNFVIDDVREHREEFVINGNSAYNFDVDVKSIGGSGQPFEVFVAFTHYSTTYGAAYHAAYYQRSTVQSDITLIHQYFNQNSTRGGTWTVTWLSATQIRISKSAGVGGSSGYGYLRVTQVDF
jgi:hypothetical protein